MRFPGETMFAFKQYALIAKCATCLNNNTLFCYLLCNDIQENID